MKEKSISSAVSMSPHYMTLIQNLHKDKLEINDKKLEIRKAINIDDHGYIPFPDFHFKGESDRPDGIISGCLAIGKNFRRFLQEMPCYINCNSALATCWVGILHEIIPIGIVPEDRPKHLLPTIEKYNISQPGFGGMNHLCPDVQIGLDLGWFGLLEKVRTYRSRNNPKDTSFYDGEEQLLLGIIEWVQAHGDLAESLAEKEEDPFCKKNYLEIARINQSLAARPPKTFREACQYIAHFQAIDRTYYAGGGLGQIDELLRPYFEADIAAGILTEDEAVWYIASLFFNDTHYSQLGGLIPDGSRDVTSRISYIILDAMHHLGIPVNLGLRIHDDMDEELLRRTVEYTIEDGYGCYYVLNKGVVEGFAANGYPLELGRMRIKSGCNWVAIPGREYPLQDVTRLNMATALHHALQDIKKETSYSLDRLWTLFCKHLKVMLDCIKEGYDCHYEVVSRNTPEIVLNLFMHGPIERGLNCAEGGVDIMNLNVDGIALATVADSFGAIQQRIVEEGRLTWEQLFDILEKDYEGCENERLMLKNIQRFGTPSSCCEEWAVRVKNEFVSQCKSSPTPKHRLMIIPGLFSHGDVYAYGKKLPATPNGRKAGEPISHSAEPDPGFARGLNTFSPALKANAVALVQAGYGNSAPLHLDIDNGMLVNANGVEALMALIHAHERMGGTLINMNCITKEKLLEAHENPAAYPDLVVRVTGYAAFFASLSKEYRQQIVDRFLSAS